LRWQLDKDSELLKAALKWNTEVLGTEAILFLSSCSGEAKHLRISSGTFHSPQALEPPEIKYWSWPKQGKSRGSLVCTLLAVS